MPSCDGCKKGEFHGFPPEGSPEWEVGTIYFWCPEMEHHDMYAPACNLYYEGAPKMYDKRGKYMGRVQHSVETEG